MPDLSVDETTPPEITAVVQQAVAACRSSRNDPTCVKAQALCRRVNGTTAATIEGLGELCAVAKMPAWVWWALGGAVVVGGGVGVVLYRRRRR